MKVSQPSIDSDETTYRVEESHWRLGILQVSHRRLEAYLHHWNQKDGGCCLALRFKEMFIHDDKWCSEF